MKARLKKIFDQLCLLTAGVFFASSVMLFVLPATGFCEWAEPLFGPAVTCDFKPVSQVLMFGSILSWYWIGFALALTSQHWTAFTVAWHMIAVNILALRGFALLLKPLPIFQNRKIWYGFVTSIFILGFLVVAWILGLFVYLFIAIEHFRK